MTSKPRIGPTMRALADYVSAQPGCSKAQALRGVGLPDRGLGYLRPVERAIGAGLVIEVHVHRTLCRLFASERDGELFDLGLELRHGGLSAERLAEIATRIHDLRGQQARAYALAQGEGEGQ